MIAAVPDNSCTETKEQMLEASIISTNWLGRRIFPQVSGLARVTEAHGEAA